MRIMVLRSILHPELTVFGGVLGSGVVVQRLCSLPTA